MDPSARRRRAHRDCCLSFWDSEESIKSLIGDDIAVPVFFPMDEHYLIDRERTVSHYSVWPGPDSA